MSSASVPFVYEAVEHFMRISDRLAWIVTLLWCRFGSIVPESEQNVVARGRPRWQALCSKYLSLEAL
ncbi:hypothetical protein K491DRAFT_691268 [Lophiostoma macrostomum CBS 122681]|uniref:Uncharacterized protein n=1 Tax=Lophiostoma macrostomum CBS 122681 TaxID=1314788 RepID=A0A6A6TD71_9PLEO|nr:hypothetical protein K491DRAFT_691268 [Lophiostoma macrostomum CBS 122681]